MDNKYKSINLRVGVGFIVAALLTGQSAIAAETPAQPTAKSTKPAKKAKASKRAKNASLAAKSTQVAEPLLAPITAKPVVASTAKAVETSPLGEEARELTEPKSSIEAGVLGVTDSNWKFGQYNWLTNSGAYGIGNLDLRGGGSYDSGDATRWRFTGKNIGLETREFTGEYKDQGKYKLNFGYDEIYRNGQGSYMTPYIGAGGNNLVLPGNWQNPVVSNAYNSTNPGQPNPTPNMRGLTAGDMADFRNTDLSTKRRRVDGGFSYFLNPEWELKASMRHENRDGTQPLGAAIGGLRAAIIPNPISQSTDQINASMNFTGEKAFGTFAYYGSIFHNDYDSVNFQNAYIAPQAKTNALYGRMSTMPDNQFHQFTLSGGYNFSADTKLIGSGGYGRNWQDQGFLPYSTLVPNSTPMPIYPAQSSLNGAVDFKNVNVKLTHKASADLNFAAAYKYDERENLSAVNAYKFIDVDSTYNATNPNIAYRNNTPFSRRVQTGNLDANYSFAKGHWLKLGYEVQNIDRWCNGTWVSCVDTSTTLENIGRIDYRGSFFDKLNAKLGYAYSNRGAYNYNQDNAWLASYGPAKNAALFNQYLASGLTAWGPNLGWVANGQGQYPTIYPNNNTLLSSILVGGNGGLDVSGLRRFNTAARNRQSFNSRLDYQLNDKWSLGLNGDYRYDDYPQSVYGLQSQRTWSINFDSNYAFNEDLSGHVFYTFQDNMSKTQSASWSTFTGANPAGTGSVNGGCPGSTINTVLAMNNNAKINPCLNWLSNMSDNIDTVGLGLKHKGLFSGKLDLVGDFLYSFARTQVNVNGGVYSQQAGFTGATRPYYWTPATDLPEVKTQVFQFNLNAKYAITKSSAAHLTYMFQHMISNDYIYYGMNLYGTPTGVMPTNMQAPTYSVHAIGLSYIYNF